MIEIRLFGSTRLAAGDRRWGATDLGGVKSRQVLEILAVELGSPVPKDVLAERLWDGHPPTSCIATIESCVCVLRRHLGLVKGRHSPLATTSRGYILDPDQVTVDLNEVYTRLRGTRSNIEQALGLVGGVLLADDPYASWATEARSALDSELADACVAAASSANRDQDGSRAVRFAREAMRHSVYSEPALRELMLGLERTGAPGEALRAYGATRRTMLEELGVEPGPEVRDIYVAILRGESHRSPGTTQHDEVCTLVALLRDALLADPALFLGVSWPREFSRLSAASA